VWGALDALLEAGSAGSPAPFWAIPWVGGQALARYLLDHPELVAGKAILDFAAGSGVAGIAALRAGAASVLATELDPTAVAVMAHNAALNGIAVGPEGLLPSAENVVGVSGPWAVVLAGDVCYERGPAGIIFEWLRTLAAHRLVLLADPGRAFLPADGLLALWRQRVPAHLDTEGVTERDTTVYRVLPR
jgi:predicted nicotinamide N-methyase